MPRSLRELDQELVKHRLVFGRGKEKGIINDLLSKGDRAALVTGMEGTGKTSLILDLLRDLGGSSSAEGPGAQSLIESGHAFYFKDLGTFIRFLEVRNRPITLKKAELSIKWDGNNDVRREAILAVGEGKGVDLSRDRRSSASGTSCVLQTERLLIQTKLEVVVETKFEEEEVLKGLGTLLTRYSNELANTIEQARREHHRAGSDNQGYYPNGSLGLNGIEGPGNSYGFTLPFIFTILDVMDGRSDEQNVDHRMAICSIEEQIESIIETLNKEIYMSLSMFLTRGSEDKGKIQFEESLQLFLDNAHMDKLVPGRVTFWRWYFGLDHLEREIPGWTLDRKRNAIKLILEKFSEKEGFHLIAALDNNPQLIFRAADTVPGAVSLNDGYEGRMIRTFPIEFPEKETFISDVTRYALKKVEDVQGLSESEIRTTLEILYDRCHGKLRLYYLIRNIKNLKILKDLGIGVVSPDTTFIDKQIHEALGQLGEDFESDMSIENVWAIRPLISLAEFEGRRAKGDQSLGISKSAFSWFLKAYGIEKRLDLNKYLQTMELYGILKNQEDRVMFYNQEIGYEFNTIVEGRKAEKYPLIAAFLSSDGLERFMRYMGLDDILQLSEYLILLAESMTDTSIFETDPFDILLAKGSKNYGIPDIEEKKALLTAILIRSGLLSRIGDKEGRKAESASILIKMMEKNKDPRLMNMVSRGLVSLTLTNADKRMCVSCGTTLAGSHVSCPVCHMDYREACHGCGRRILPPFIYCPFCKVELRSSSK